MTAGAVEAFLPRLVHASWSVRSMTWTCRCSVFAGQRCRSPMPNISSRRLSRSLRASSRSLRKCCPKMGEFRMPSLGADMEAGILVEWRVKSGDRVRRGDIIAEVETDKGLIEIEVFEDGVVDQLLIEPGKKLPVGTVLATILGEGALPAAPLTPMVPPGTIERARISEV